MNNSLFEDFNPVSEKEWKQKIQVDLKGKDYNETMLTQTDEGIDIKPFYHRESNTDINIPTPKKWYITEDIYPDEDELVNTLSAKGTEAVFLDIKHSKNIPQQVSNTDLTFILLLKNLDLDDINPDQNLILLFDPISNFIQTGNWIENQNKDIEKLQKFVNKTNNLAIDARLFHNAGANISQQLAYITAQLQSYLALLEHNSKPLNIFIFNAVGTNYFFEIAKLKSIRLLVNTICRKYKIPYELKLISEPGIHHMSIYDYNVNMLRATSASMSAILGGSDFVKNTCYDIIFKHKNDFSRRIARNQLLILKHESYFDKVENISDGTYYINYLIKALSEKALAIFKDIEKSGGLIQQLFDGKIQEKINQQLQKTIDKFKSKELKLIGVNVYVNDDDKMAKQLEKEIFDKTEKRKTLIKPVKPKRIAEILEKQRLKEESA